MYLVSSPRPAPPESPLAMPSLTHITITIDHNKDFVNGKKYLTPEADGTKHIFHPETWVARGGRLYGPVPKHGCFVIPVDIIEGLPSNLRFREYTRYKLGVFRCGASKFDAVFYNYKAYFGSYKSPRQPQLCHSTMQPAVSALYTP